MKIFISWSGKTSKAVAIELHRWLKDVIQVLDPWMSDIDIQAGARWNAEIAANLEESNFGIICITRENLEAPWILFEAGALAKSLNNTFVCPYLFGLSRTDIPPGPLTQFQSKCANKEHTLGLLCSINNAIGVGKLDQYQLQRAFERCWPELEERLQAIPEMEHEEINKRPIEEMVSETLILVRNLSSSIGEVSTCRANFQEDRADREWMAITQAINNLYQLPGYPREILMRCYDNVEKDLAKS